VSYEHERCVADAIILERAIKVIRRRWTKATCPFNLSELTHELEWLGSRLLRKAGVPVPHKWDGENWTCLQCGQVQSDPCGCPCCATRQGTYGGGLEGGQESRAPA
jgi:rubrerythrin